MDDLQTALEDFKNIYQNFFSRRSHQRPCNYAQTRHSAARLHSTIPRLATHYRPLSPLAPNDATSLKQRIFAHAACETGLPVPFTPDEVQFVIDTGASITITYDKNDLMDTYILFNQQPCKESHLVYQLPVSGMLLTVSQQRTETLSV